MTNPTDMSGLLELMSGLPRPQIDALIAQAVKNRQVDEHTAQLHVAAGMAAGGGLASLAALLADAQSDAPEMSQGEVETICDLSIAGALTSIALSLLAKNGQAQP